MPKLLQMSHNTCSRRFSSMNLFLFWKAGNAARHQILSRHPYGADLAERMPERTFQLIRHDVEHRRRIVNNAIGAQRDALVQNDINNVQNMRVGNARYYRPSRSSIAAFNAFGNALLFRNI